MNIDVEPIWKSPYFQYIKRGKEKKEKGGKNNIDLLFPCSSDQSTSEKSSKIS